MQEPASTWRMHSARPSTAAICAPSASRTFLRAHWTSYPSWSDQGKQIADAIGIHLGLPTTVFYGPDGKTYVHQGQYRSAAQLNADIARYALHA